MNTLLLIPTEESVGLTSACLGMIYALDCSGIKAGFVKPFCQEQDQHHNRTAALYAQLFQTQVGS